MDVCFVSFKRLRCFEAWILLCLLEGAATSRAREHGGRDGMQGQIRTVCLLNAKCSGVFVNHVLRSCDIYMQW
jgi:hypothetical protein